MASNVVAQSELRRALIQRYGQAKYEATEFPRLLDDTTARQLLTATERRNGDRAVIHLQRGSNLQFLQTGSGWKFDFFRTIPARPAEIRALLEKEGPILRQLTQEVSRGDFPTAIAAQVAFQSRR